MQQEEIYKAYSRTVPDYSARTARMEIRFDYLLTLSRQVESDLMRLMKPLIALALKWRFDFLSKTLESPFELERDIEYWIGVMETMKILGAKKWFEISTDKWKTKDAWIRTAEGFDKGWTANTSGIQFEISRNIARERLNQILELLGGSSYMKGKEILDSGCGPGRYIDLMRNLEPKKITGLEQGPRLIEVLKERFKDDPRVNIVKGTCEKLDLQDESFDFVMSNGVLHHTPSDLRTMIADHARVLRKNGAMFIMLVGKGGLELKIWQFLRDFLYDIPIEKTLETFRESISPLRLQGVVDHMYGEYQETSREEFEHWCSGIFAHIIRVTGISGLDVTPELYRDDPYFEPRFGCGQLRYLCFR